MYKKIKSITSLIRSRLGLLDGETPEIGIILGSGLGALSDQVEVRSVINYSDIEGFPQSTVAGHQGRFIYGMLGGRQVLLMQGRVHFYEGYTIEQVVLPVRVMVELGIQILIVSNAAGGLNPDFQTGDLMIIEDHISLLPNPLIGANNPEVGVQFPSMRGAYDPLLIADLRLSALRIGLDVRSGIYLGWSGPSYETPAEYRMYRTFGADTVGMSTTVEVIVARHAGVRVLGISLVANVVGEGALLSTSHEEVQAVGLVAGEKMCRLLIDFLEH